MANTLQNTEADICLRDSTLFVLRPLIDLFISHDIIKTMKQEELYEKKEFQRIHKNIPRKFCDTIGH